MTLAITILITNLVKNYLGYLRPDFLNRCSVNFELVTSTLGQFQNGGLNSTTSVSGVAFKSGTEVLWTGAICRNSGTAIYTDGRRSFPSGHSSCNVFSDSLVFESN